MIVHAMPMTAHAMPMIGKGHCGHGLRGRGRSHGDTACCKGGGRGAAAAGEKGEKLACGELNDSLEWIAVDRVVDMCKPNNDALQHDTISHVPT